jgi:hypothetical protein
VKRCVLSIIAIAASLVSMPSFSMERCRITDPTGTPLNVRDVHMNIIGVIQNGWIVLVRRYGEDSQGTLWVFIETPEGEPIGWVYREFISCF